MPHCPVTVVQRYRDGVCSLLFHSFFIICHPYIPLHLEEMIFIYTCYTAFWMCQCTIYNIGAKRDLHYTCNYHFLLDYLPSLLIPTFFRYAARGDRTRTAPLRRYATNLYAMLHSLVINHTTNHNTCAHGRSRRGTLASRACGKRGLLSTNCVRVFAPALAHGL